MTECEALQTGLALETYNHGNLTFWQVRPMSLRVDFRDQTGVLALLGLLQDPVIPAGLLSRNPAEEPRSATLLATPLAWFERE
mgnify:CR=1 FL=1